jgi:hypothetical protein
MFHIRICLKGRHWKNESLPCRLSVSTVNSVSGCMSVCLDLEGIFGVNTFFFPLLLLL